MPLPRVVFYGSDAIALPSLDFLAGEGAASCELVGVLTQPDRPSGRGKKLRPNPVKAWAEEKGISVSEPQKPGEAEVKCARRADLALVMAYGHILSRELLDAPVHGTFNLHGSLLPAYRGASPVETALALGERDSGVTLMRVVPRMDAGPLVDAEVVVIESGADGPSFRLDIAAACVPLLRRNLRVLLAGEAEERPQDEAAATYCRKLRKEDALLDFRSSASVLARRVAAFRGWPGSRFVCGDVVLNVGEAQALEELSLAPGEIGESEEFPLVVGTGRGSLALLELQRPGGRMMPAADFLRGFPLRAGEVLREQDDLTELLVSPPDNRSRN